MVDTCMSGDFCVEDAVPSLTFPGRKMFCQNHQDRLTAIKEELEDKAWSNNIRNKEGTKLAFCETPGCDNRPVYGGDFCDECQGE